MPYKKLENIKERKFTQYRLLVGGLIVGLFILTLSQLIVSNQLATRGEEIRKIETQITDISQENEILANQVSSYSALSAISQQASRLNLHPAKVLYLRPETNVALNK